MQANPLLQDKPISQIFRPELTRLPPSTFWRRAFRVMALLIVKLVVHLLVRLKVQGAENLPRAGPSLIVTNHLGDADAVITLAVNKTPIDALAKVELYDFPIIGMLMQAYGVIWIHRGRPDRRAIKAALSGLEEGRLIVIAPEGRESLSGSLEKGTNGAAYIALKANVPIIVLTITGTENKLVFKSLKSLHRIPVVVTAGKAFYLNQKGDIKMTLEEGTDKIMRAMASQLPESYRGVYREGLSNDG